MPVKQETQNNVNGSNNNAAGGDITNKTTNNITIISGNAFNLHVPSNYESARPQLDIFKIISGLPSIDSGQILPNNSLTLSNVDELTHTILNELSQVIDHPNKVINSILESMQTMSAQSTEGIEKEKKYFVQQLRSSLTSSIKRISLNLTGKNIDTIIKERETPVDHNKTGPLSNLENHIYEGILDFDIQLQEISGTQKNDVIEKLNLMQKKYKNFRNQLNNLYTLRV
jgi:hypothetical protein